MNGVSVFHHFILYNHKSICVDFQGGLLGKIPSLCFQANFEATTIVVWTTTSFAEAARVKSAPAPGIFFQREDISVIETHTARHWMEQAYQVGGTCPKIRVNLEKNLQGLKIDGKNHTPKAPLQVFATNPPFEKVAMATLVTSMLFEHPRIWQNTMKTHGKSKAV